MSSCDWLIKLIRCVAVVAVVLSLPLASSCHREKGGCHIDDTRYTRLDSMLATITDADSLAALAAQSHEQHDDLTEMLALKYQGRLLRNQTRFEEALKAHADGLKIATSLADTLEMANALNNLGTDYRRMGDLSIANGYYYQTLKLTEACSGIGGDEALKARINALNGIGNIEIELCNYAVADSVLRESLRGEQRLGRHVGMAINYANLGAIKRSIGDNDSAWVYFRKSMEYNQLANSQVGVALCHMHFGDLHSDERRFSHAQEEYKQAYDLLKQADDNWHLMEVCLALARVNVLLGEEDAARGYLQEVEVEAQRMGSKEHLANAYDIHYELALLAGNSQAALQYFVRSKELQDSIQGPERFDEMHRQRIDYERNRTSGEINVLNRDISHLKLMRNIQIVMLILLLIMAAAIIAALTYAVRVRNRTQRLMRQVEETRSLFFTNVVHQLRTPLTAIMGAIDGILAGERKDDETKDNDTRSRRENAELIERQGKNLLLLVDRILEVGGVRSAIKALEWRHGDAITLIRMVVEKYRERCVERHIELTFAPSKSSLEVDTVPRYLITIVGSLVENAVNYCNEMDRITVTASIEKNMLVIKVADTGMGICKADLPHVFEPFYRAAAAEQVVEGVGIGLTVVRDMAMAMGGVVAADSTKDRGSVFTVKLPCRHGTSKLLSRFDDQKIEVADVAAPQQPRTERLTEDSPATAASDAPVVLIVEDHSDVARLVGLVLGDEYQVHYATDGEQGFSKACSLQPDLVITDVKMPLMDGLELCRKLKQTRRLCHIPVIVLSARNSEADRVRGVEAGADAYLVKPFVPEEMRAWVKHLLESRKMLRDVFASPVTAPAQGAPLAGSSIDMEDQEFLDRFAIEVYKQSAQGAKLDYDRIARSMKMGESQMRNRIQLLTGKNVPAHVTSLRMDKAIRLLRSDSDMLIGDIAEQCGFQDVAYFSRVFRQHFGMTPTQARQSRN